MPWTKKDVESHKKGLSDSQKEKWTKIANSVRSDCMKKGGSEKDCDAKAIRIANSQVNTNMQINFEPLPAYTPREEMYDGKQYLVVPVVMMVQGVHSGSHGPVYHDPEEFGKIPHSWNGMPVTLQHPVNDEGEFVPVGSPEVLSSFSVGQVFRTNLDGDKLKAEAWIDVQKLTAISPQTLQKIRDGEIMEVSVGIFTDEDEEEGDWNNEHYIAVVKNYRPNHLALLPGEVGACSIADGCGLRVNSNKKEGGKENVNRVDVLKQAQEVGLKEINTNFFVYVENDEEFKQEFNLVTTGDTSGTITLGELIKVNKEEKSMACAKCPEKVDALIANSATHFEESDRDWLNELTEDKLDKLIPKKVVQTNESQNQGKTITESEAWSVLKLSKEQYEMGVKVYNDQRAEVTKEILDNSEKDVWSEDELKSLKLEVLKKIAKTLKKKEEQEVGNYIGMGAGIGTNGKSSGSKPYIPEIEFAEKK